MRKYFLHFGQRAEVGRIVIEIEQDPKTPTTRPPLVQQEPLY